MNSNIFRLDWADWHPIQVARLYKFFFLNDLKIILKFYIFLQYMSLSSSFPPVGFINGFLDTKICSQ